MGSRYVVAYKNHGGDVTTTSSQKCICTHALHYHVADLLKEDDDADGVAVVSRVRPHQTHGVHHRSQVLLAQVEVALFEVL